MAVNDILNYLKENRAKFPLETLVNNLQKSGYPEGEIQEALRIIQNPPMDQSTVDEQIPTGIPVMPPQSVAGQMVPNVWKKIGAWFLGFIATGIIFALLWAVYMVIVIFGYRGLGFGYGSSYTPFFVILGIFEIVFLGAVLGTFYLTRNRYWYFAMGVLSAGVAAVLITGIVTFTVYQSFERARVLSRDSRRVSDIKQLQLALELYYDVYNQYPENFDLLAPIYIPSIPKDPVSQAAYYYEKRDSGYYMKAELENPSNYALQNDVNPGNQFYEVEEKPASYRRMPTANPSINPFSQLATSSVANPFGASNNPAASKTFKVLFPNGGNAFFVRSTFIITWEANPALDKISIFLRSSGGLRDRTIAHLIPNTGNYTWYVPEDVPSGIDYSIEITASCPVLPCTHKMGVDQDTSDSFFSIFDSSQSVRYLKLISPNGKETLCLGKEHVISWESSGVDEVFLWLKGGPTNNSYQIGGFPATFNDANTTGVGEYVWKVGENSSTASRQIDTEIKEGYNWKLQINSVDGKQSALDTSDNLFSIITCEG